MGRNFAKLLFLILVLGVVGRDLSATLNWQPGPSGPNIYRRAYTTYSDLNGDTFYLFGGFESSTGTETTASSAFMDTWLIPPPPNMFIAREYACAVATLDTIYVIGGTAAAGTVYETIVERYTPASGLWSPGPNLPVGLKNPIVALVGDTIYVIGGEFNAGIDTGAVYALNTLTNNAWIHINDAPFLLSGAAAGVYDPDIYVIGGRVNGIDTVAISVFNTLTYTWSPNVGNLIYPFSRNGYVQRNDLVYLIGDATGDSSIIQVYNMTSNICDTETPLPRGMLYYAMGFVGDTLIVTAGCDTSIANSGQFTWISYVPPTPSNIWYVNDTSTAGDVYTTAIGYDTNPGTADAPFRTITQALTIAKAGDTIYIDAGTYAETVVIDTDGISLIGADSVSTIIDPPGDSTVSGLKGILVNFSDSVTIKQLMVTGAEWGIHIQGLYAVLKNIQVYNNARGIEVSSDYGRYEDIVSKNNSEHGFSLWYASYNIFRHNLTDGDGIGIYFYGYGNCNNNLFVQNTIRNSGTSGVSINYDSSNETFVYNNIYVLPGATAVENNCTYYFIFAHNYWGSTNADSIYAAMGGLFADSVIFRPFRFSEIDTAVGADTIAPATPYNVSVQSGDGACTITWSDSAYDEDGSARDQIMGYRIYRSTAPYPGDWQPPIAEVPYGVTTYFDTPLTNEQTYYYRITAFDTHNTGTTVFENESWYSDVAIGTPSATPQAIVLWAQALDSSVYLEWQPSGEQDINTYQVYRSLGDTSNFSLLTSLPSSQTFYYDSGVVSPNTYYYVVTAVDLIGLESKYSNIAYAPRIVIYKDYVCTTPLGGTLPIPGSIIEYEVTAYNNGYGPSDAAVIEDYLPAYTELYDSVAAGDSAEVLYYKTDGTPGWVSTWEGHIIEKIKVTYNAVICAGDSRKFWLRVVVK